MEGIAIEYIISNVEGLEVQVLLPKRMFIAKKENEELILGDERIPSIENAIKENKPTGYYYYTELEAIYSELKKNNIDQEEGLANLKDGLYKIAQESVLYVENGEIKQLSTEEFEEEFGYFVDYENCVIRKTQEINFKTCREIVDNITKTIMFQDKQIRMIVSKLTNNFILEKPRNIILNGSTGTGKTRIIELLTKELNMPIAHIEGFSGENLNAAYVNLFLQSKSMKSNQENGVIFIDDIFQGIKKFGELDGDILVEIVTTLLRKKSKFPLQISEDKVALFDPAKITYIFAIDLEKKIKEPPILGINNDKSEERIKIIKSLKEKLTDANCEIIDMNELNESELLTILEKSEGSPIKEYTDLLERQGINLNLSRNALKIIAHEAYKLQKGAKGLRIVTEYAIGEDIANAQYNQQENLSITAPKLIKKLGLKNETSK